MRRIMDVIGERGSPLKRPGASERGGSAFLVSFGAALRARLTIIDLSDISYAFSQGAAFVYNSGSRTHHTPVCSAVGLK